MNATRPEFLSTLVVSFPQGPWNATANAFPDLRPLLTQPRCLGELENHDGMLELEQTGIPQRPLHPNALVLKV